jgi:class 3 adenylate cyclase/tetratricopeptide (TPR) repeat protein
MTALLETLASYVPAMIARRIASPLTSFELPHATQFPAAVLYADISGFSVLADQLAQQGPVGAEELTRLLNDYFGQLIDLIVAHGGEVVKFAGDALLAFWAEDERRRAAAEGEREREDDIPAPPLSHPPSSLSVATLRAAQCALAMQALLRVELANDQVPLTMHIGIGAGDVTAMRLGGVNGHWELLVTGAPIVQAAMAEHAAQAGEVIVSAEAWELVTPQCVGTASLNGGERVVRLDAVQLPLPLSPARASELATLSAEALRAYVPLAVSSRIEAGQTAWLAELRTITTLFINLPDLNARTSLTQAQHVMRALQTVINRYQGSINKLSVDDKGITLIAVLGLPPLAHEDDALRGVRAALEAEGALRELGLNSAIGITTGRAFCGSVGNERRREYTMIGDVVNLAARLMQAAQPMANPESSGVNAPPQASERKTSEAMPLVLCDEATYEAAHAQLDFETLSPLSVKGKPEPIPCYRPIGQRRFTARTDNVLVGRARERQSLLQALERLVRDKVSSYFLIEGEAGIGKSQLIAELRRQAEAQRLSVFVGAGSAIEQATPYQGWRGVFSQLFDLNVMGDLEKRRRHILDLLELEPELEKMAPLFNSVLPLDLPDNEHTAQLTGAARANRTRDLLLQTLQWSCARSPKLLILEDAHWFDTASWALAWLMIQRVQPMMLILATRPLLESGDGAAMTAAPEYSLIRETPTVQTLKLDVLTPSDVVTLVCQRLGVSKAPAEVLSFIQEKAQGNPFFSVELAYALYDENAIIVEGDECRLAAGVDNLRELHLPDTVQGAITSRIDRLPPPQQLALKTASVIGREFELDLLRDIYPVATDHPHLPNILNALQRHDLLAVEMRELVPLYRFKHAIIQEVVYNLMLYAQRRALHRVVAEWHERTYAGDLSRFYSVLAYHWQQANHAAKALAYFELAGEQALSFSAYQEALTFFNQAHALAMTPAEAAPSAAATETQPPSRLASLTLRLGEVSMLLGETAAARERFEESLTLARQLNDPQRSVDALNMLGRLEMARGEHDKAMTLYRECLSLAETHEHRLGMAQTLNNMGLVERQRGNYTQAEAYFTQSLQIHSEIANQGGVAGALTNLGQMARVRGKLADATTYFEHALILFRKLHSQTNIAHVLNQLGVVAETRGLYNEAENHFQEALEIYRDIGHRAGMAWSLSNLGDCALLRGDYETAGSLFHDSLDLRRALGDQGGLIWDWVSLGRVMLGFGNIAEAKQYFHEAIQLAQRLNLEPRLLYAVAGFAQLRLQEGQTLRAAELLGLALHHPSSDSEIEASARPILTALRVLLPLNQLNVALLRGQTLELQQVIRELIGEP